MTKLIALVAVAALGAGGAYYVATRHNGPGAEEFCAHMLKLIAAEGTQTTPEKFQQCVGTYSGVMAVANTPTGRIAIECSMQAQTFANYMRCWQEWTDLQPR